MLSYQVILSKLMYPNSFHFLLKLSKKQTDVTKLGMTHS